MDLRPIADEPDERERLAVDRALAGHRVEDPAPRTLLLPALRAVMAACGWIRKPALGYIAARMHLPPAEVYGVATFYHLLATEPSAPEVLHVCDDVACRLRGSEELTRGLEKSAGPEGRGDARTWKRSPCLGQCERAPVALQVRAGSAPVERAVRIDGTPHAVALAAGGEGEEILHPTIQQPREELVLLRRVGAADPGSIDGYRASGGYEGLRRAHAKGPAWVLRELAEARLLGRGGAGFPAGTKWSAVAAAPSPEKYIVCNADESEPGTFKDRVLLEGDPFAILEAMTVAGLAVGAERGVLYVRGEYPLAARRITHAIEVARARGALGANILGSGQRFDVEVRRGAGAYICGEETALLESIEGRRGEPRSKPPFPVHAGLFGRPTLIHNVETLAASLAVIRQGAVAFASRGTAQSTGTRLFCVSGHVARPGVYELPMGTPLRALLTRAGVALDALQAVLLGGAAGTFLRPDEIDLRLTFEDARSAGATLGSGAVVVFDRSASMIEVLRGLTRFFRHESCGQCVPCRVGTVRMDELVTRIALQRPKGTWGDERARLADLGAVLRDASICGLGQTAASAVESAVARWSLWPDEGGA